MLFFFFKQKTAYEMHISDWSSDVCSSDLFVVAWFALAKLGAVTVPVNTSYKGKFLDNVANNCGAEICISHPDFLETWLSSEDNCPTLRALYVIDDQYGYQVTEKFHRISINSFASLYADEDRKSTRLNSSHKFASRMLSSA